MNGAAGGLWLATFHVVSSYSPGECGAGRQVLKAFYFVRGHCDVLFLFYFIVKIFFSSKLFFSARNLVVLFS